MPLRVLDGNQTATTLSSVVTGGEHIVAHTVVSLGSTAISNITSAVSGSVVSVSNFPASQTVAGTVTANVQGKSQSGTIYDLPVGYREDVGNGSVSVVVPVYPVGGTAGLPFSAANPIEARATVTVGNTVTIGSLPALAAGTAQIGSVTASITGTVPVSISSVTVGNSVTIGSIPAISGTVTVGNSVTIGSLPTLTPQLPRVTFIDGSGTVTTANTAVTVFASSSTRSYLLVQVTTGSAFVNVGATATTLNGISLTAGQGYAWETTIPQGIVSLISTTTSSRYVAKQA